MVGEEEQAGRVKPRLFLIDPTRFGQEPDALWRPLAAGEQVRSQITAYWHHLAVCTLRESYPTQLVEELSTRLRKDNDVYLRRQVAGEYRVSVEELFEWVLAFDDITLLPSPGSATELLPPLA
jgi:hypothetical protein